MEKVRVLAESGVQEVSRELVCCVSSGQRVGCADEY